ncbi:unnamed protein product, partial [Brassica rapa subsp. trilocularis]
LIQPKSYYPFLLHSDHLKVIDTNYWKVDPEVAVVE